jgi:Ca2+-transporting ATPase
MGGVTGLLAALGTHATRGLGKKASSGEGTAVEPADADGKVGGAGPAIVVTDPAGDKMADRGGEAAAEAKKAADANPAAFEATMEERRRVYGENVLPTRKSKSLLQLMWLALKDKVLVCNHFQP